MIVLANDMSPAPVSEFNVILPSRVTPVAKLILSFDVVMSPAVDTVPKPFWVKAPARLMSLVASIVNVPLLVIVTEPLFVVVIPLVLTSIVAPPWFTKVRFLSWVKVPALAILMAPALLVSPMVIGPTIASNSASVRLKVPVASFTAIEVPFVFTVSVVSEAVIESAATALKSIASAAITSGLFVVV